MVDRGYKLELGYWDSMLSPSRVENGLKIFIIELLSIHEPVITDIDIDRWFSWYHSKDGKLKNCKVACLAKMVFGQNILKIMIYDWDC